MDGSSGLFLSGIPRGKNAQPCFRCNPRMKFGTLIEKASAQGIQFDYLASDHDVDCSRSGSGFLSGRCWFGSWHY
jgi:tRNA U34 2-thiouridine synthase MnmA/TrmU